ncbi:hydroxyacylglutathione hydrolase [Psychromonas aquimarina]|uniref:hydroxyacylglutathione hydrolase n=1 Tax=Psychromonas aquimarina TaxID=444919 RepID=UPI00041750C8|nr:hydroxyacylglutathione hydrolase [Psychromonas aquimarina]
MVNILTLKSFDDNYIWLIKDSQSQHCIVVDPGDAGPVLEILEAQQLIVDAVILTHGHYDHIDGVEALLSVRDEKIAVYCQKKLFAKSEGITDGQTLSFFDGRFSLKVMAVPGHTLDHVAYYNESFLFCGDTLFSGGCGRVFEGSYEQMFEALSRFTSLPDNTLVYCAHEYTQNNLIFAFHLEPKNEALLKYIQEVSKKRQQGLPTIPTTIGLEKSINPFLRCSESSLVNALQMHLAEQLSDPLSCFTALRKYKDRF